MIKKIVIKEALLYAVACALGILLIYLERKGIIFYAAVFSPEDGASGLYSTLVSFFGGNLGFVIASVTIVFGIVEKRSFDGLFKNDQVKKLYVLFFSIILSSALNAVFNFFAMAFAPKSKDVFLFSTLFLAVWLLQFYYFVRIFFAVIKVSVNDRKSTIADEQKKRVSERQLEGKSIVSDDDKDL